MDTTTPQRLPCADQIEEKRIQLREIANDINHPITRATLKHEDALSELRRVKKTQPYILHEKLVMADTARAEAAAMIEYEASEHGLTRVGDSNTIQKQNKAINEADMQVGIVQKEYDDCSTKQERAKTLSAVKVAENAVSKLVTELTKLKQQYGVSKLEGELKELQDEQATAIKDKVGDIVEACNDRNGGGLRAKVNDGKYGIVLDILRDGIVYVVEVSLNTDEGWEKHDTMQKVLGAANEDVDRIIENIKHDDQMIERANKQQLEQIQILETAKSDLPQNHKSRKTLDRAIEHCQGGGDSVITADQALDHAQVHPKSLWGKLSIFSCTRVRDNRYEALQGVVNAVKNDANTIVNRNIHDDTRDGSSYQRESPTEENNRTRLNSCSFGELANRFAEQKCIETAERYNGLR